MNTGMQWAPNTASRENIGRSFSRVVSKNPTLSGPQAKEIQDLVHDVIDSQLAAKGYRPETGEKSDFWVLAKISRTERSDAQTATLSEEEYTQGSLYIYLIDPATREWIWRSWADARLDPSHPPDVKRKRLVEAVTKMLEALPSQK